MHDSESDVSHPINKHEEYCEMLKKMGIAAEAEPIDTDEIEKEDCFSKNFTHTPSMVTNHGIVKLQSSHIDVIQIIQKG